MKDKSCKNCNNKNCYIVSDIPFDKRKDVLEHHENYDWNKVSDCKNHNQWKEQRND